MGPVPPLFTMGAVLLVLLPNVRLACFPVPGIDVTAEAGGPAACDAGRLRVVLGMGFGVAVGRVGSNCPVLVRFSLIGGCCCGRECLLSSVPDR
jgi:hypothetical protein